MSDKLSWQLHPEFTLQGTYLEEWTGLGVVALHAHAEEKLMALGSFEQGAEGSDVNFNVSFLSNEKQQKEQPHIKQRLNLLFSLYSTILAGQGKFNNN